MKRQHGISGFELLPDGCLSHIISFTSPKDACRSSTLSKIVKSAADSNIVWEHFLPIDYEDIISRASTSLLTFSSKKQLYVHLCDSSILLDEATLSFTLSKASGKKCYMLCSRGLQITWGQDSRYWKWTSLPESRFTEVAELKSVCWLEIRAKIKVEMLSHDTEYATYLVFQLKEQPYYSLSCPANSFIRLVSNDGEFIRVQLSEINDMGTIVYLDNPNENWSGRRPRGQKMLDGRYPPKRRLDGWMEIELGQPFNSSEQNFGSVEIVFWETDDFSWKSGLIVEGIELRPIE